MTLNVTVAGPKAIYQSADFRLKDLATDRLFDFETQKIVLVPTSSWAASICFAGLGRTGTTDVGEWLAALGLSITLHDPFERLIDGLVEADSWLSQVPDRDRRHSFTVGAFIERDPIVVLVSNFETMRGVVRTSPDRRLSVHRYIPTKPRTFVSGASDALTSAERHSIAQLVMRGTAPDVVQDRMAALNRLAAKRESTVSEACFTTHLDAFRRGSGRPHGLGARPYLPTFAFPPSSNDAVRKLLDDQFGAGGASLRAMSFARFEASEAFHRSQIQADPNDASAHSNFGAYLQDRGDRAGAEIEYLRAIELNPKHVNALGNLANVRLAEGRSLEAQRLYEAALEAEHGNENASLNFARFLADRRESSRAVQVVDDALALHSDSGRLLTLRGQLLLESSPTDALGSFEAARGRDPDQAGVEAGYAFALHLSGGETASCIGAYRTALALAPDNGELRLNLSQLLFASGQTRDAERELGQALSKGLRPDAEMEAQFYLLAHSQMETRAVLNRIQRLHSSGARLRWNVEPNIASVNHLGERWSELLRRLAKALSDDSAFDAGAWHRAIVPTKQT